MSDQTDPLEDLYTDALLNRKQRPSKKSSDPSMRDALDAAAKKMRELYTLPENWERTRGICLIDQVSKSVIGNFSEYRHKTVHTTRKLIREHQPIAIDATEEIDGYIGIEQEQRLRNKSWERDVACTISAVLLDELMVEAPNVELLLRLRLGVIQRAELSRNTQFANPSGSTIIQFAAGTNIWEAAGSDTKAAMRRQCV